MNFSDKLEQLMSELSLSQTKLSALTGIGKSSISQYLSGKNEPSRERKKEIAKALGVDDNYFDTFDMDAVVTYDKGVNLPVVVAAQLMSEPMKGYKVFNPDWTCRGFKYTVGETFVEDVSPSVCNRGFHFCEKAVDCFNYYDFNPENKVAEVLALGDVVTEDNKSCTNKIQIVREIPWTEVLEIVNTGKGCSGYCNSGDWNSGDCNSGNWNSGNRNSGNRNSGNWNSGNRNSGDWNSGDCNSGNRNSGDWNSGDCNSGDCNSGNRNSGNRNSGDCNSGDWNSGDCNSGDCNSGDWNSGDCNSGNWNSGNRNSGDWNKCNFSNGCFNTTEPKIYLFNKPSEWTYRDWANSTARRILNRIPKDVLEYILWENMSDEEKEAHPEAEITGGYLKELDTSECAVTWWRSLSNNDKSIVTSLPNFDKDIFKEITGVDVDETV